jgi:hypothetical protein
MPITVMFILYSSLNCTPYVKYHFEAVSLFKFNLTVKSVLPFWKLLVFEFLLCISEKFLCTTFAVLEKTVLLLDALNMLMLSVETTYLEPKLFLLMIFYNLYFLITNN